MADSKMRAPIQSKRMGDDTYQVWTQHIDAGNPLGIDEGHYRFAISGWKTVCDDEFIEYLEVGIIFKTNGHIPGPGQR